MAVQVWIGEKPEHPQERRAIVALANGLERLEGLYLILANFSVGGRTIDLVIIKHDAIFILELKHCDGRVFGSVNGPWYVESANGERKRLNPGRKNPYNQVISYYYSLTNFLNEHRTDFLSPQKAESTDFRTCKRAIVIAPTLQEGSQVETDWRVEIRGLDHLPTYLVTERSAGIDVSDTEMQALPRLLGLTQWQDVNALVHGVLPDWNQTPSDPEPPPVAPPPEPPPALPPPGRWDRLTGLLRGRLGRLGFALSAVALLLAIIALLRPYGGPLPESQLPSLVRFTSGPAGGVGAPGPPAATCVVEPYAAIAKGPGDGGWQTIALDGTISEAGPLVAVTLERVDYCEGTIRIAWSMLNTTDSPVTFPLQSDNIVVTDNLGNLYAIQDSASRPATLTVAPGESRRGSIAIPQAVHINAIQLYVELRNQPFGQAKWLIPLDG